MMLTRADLEDRLTYDPATGVFVWKIKRGRSRGRQVAGYKRPDGYWCIVVNCVPQMAHRLAWIMMTGSRPPADIDHINGDRADNRWANLRSATRSQNNANSRPRRDGCLKGVSKRSRDGRYVAQISVGGRKRYIGLFATEEEAHAAYAAEATKHYGEFARVV